MLYAYLLLSVPVLLDGPVTRVCVCVRARACSVYVCVRACVRACAHKLTNLDAHTNYTPSVCTVLTSLTARG